MKVSPQIADNIDQIAAFGVGRSMTTARTEATKALNRSAVEAYRQAAQETGLSIKKEWLSAQDGNTRPSHGDLDGVQVGIDDEFETDGLSTLGRSFGDPAEDCIVGVLHPGCTMKIKTLEKMNMLTSLLLAGLGGLVLGEQVVFVITKDKSELIEQPSPVVVVQDSGGRWSTRRDQTSDRSRSCRCELSG